VGGSGFRFALDLTSGISPPPRFFEIIGLGENPILILRLQQDPRKILQSNELRVLK